MIEGNEIEIHYRYSKIDQTHQYSVVCREIDYFDSPSGEGYSRNLWIFWIWFDMGANLKQSMRKNEKQKFRLLPFANSWDKNSKMIKAYKNCNSGHRVVPAILSHFQKVKNKIK